MPRTKRNKNVEIKPFDEFMALLEQGIQYTGLVEYVGFVYWTQETLWFERMNPDEWFVRPVYKQILFPGFAKNRGAPIVNTSRQRVKPYWQVQNSDWLSLSLIG